MARLSERPYSRAVGPTGPFRKASIHEMNGTSDGVAATRDEHDFLGHKTIPAAAYWGVHTARAVENFPISEVPVGVVDDLVRALAWVKKAAAQANADLGVIDRKRAGAIVLACDELIAGRLHAQFVVDVIQGGAGTSTNMNANEVIANRALELLGFDKGRYDVLHPNDHVNASQSTNDVYPTALRLAAWAGILFHVTIDFTTGVDIFSWLSILILYLFATYESPSGSPSAAPAPPTAPSRSPAL